MNSHVHGELGLLQRVAQRALAHEFAREWVDKVRRQEPHIGPYSPRQEHACRAEHVEDLSRRERTLLSHGVAIARGKPRKQMGLKLRSEIAVDMPRQGIVGADILRLGELDERSE